MRKGVRRQGEKKQHWGLGSEETLHERGGWKGSAKDWEVEHIAQVFTSKDLALGSAELDRNTGSVG